MSRRLGRLFRARAGSGAGEDLWAAAERACADHAAVLHDTRRTATDLITSRKRVELQARRLAATAEELHREAAQAVAAGRDDAARDALRRQAAAEDRLGELGRRHAELQQQEEALLDASNRLSARLDAVRARMETLRATSSTAEARARISDALSDLGREGSDVALALHGAQEQAARQRFQADALDELRSSAGTGRAGAELDRTLAEARVDEELGRLRGAAPRPPSPVADGREDRQANGRS